jgi:hypothetical protein
MLLIDVENDGQRNDEHRHLASDQCCMAAVL